jgi:hypothetical protein
MSSEPTSSVTAVTTSSLVTTAAPVTTTVNNPPAENPPVAANENEIKQGQFSYDTTSTILTVMIIILPILAIILFVLLFFFFRKSNRRYYIIIGIGVIFISQIIMTVVLDEHYKKLIKDAKTAGYCGYLNNNGNIEACVYSETKEKVNGAGGIMAGVLGVLTFLSVTFFWKKEVIDYFFGKEKVE